MPGEDIKIGPFVGGLNTFSDATSIDDTELVELINFELDIDGSLTSRPPISAVGATMPLGATGNMRVLGYFITTSGAPYLIGSDGLNSTYQFNGSVWTLITSTFAAVAMCQFKDVAWLLAPEGSANPGGKWSVAGGFVADANMPKGACIVSNKERLWVGKGKNATSNGTRLYLTDIVGLQPVWNGNYVDISSGDGENIVDLAVYFSDIIIFKQGSTFRFAFDTDPSVGDISRVSDNIGIADVGCWAAFENTIYTLFDGKVYEFLNYNYDQVNTKVPLVANDPNASLASFYNVTIWADRLFVNYFDRMFVFSLRTRTWSEWKSTVVTNIGRVIAPPPNLDSFNNPAYLYSTTPRANALYKVSRLLGTASEPMTCSFQTKNYDYQTAQRLKRLFFWGIDALIRTSVKGYALPVSYTSAVTWDQLAAYTWDQIAAYTWDRPLDISLVVSEDVSTSGITGGRKFIKLSSKSLRFRQIAFRVVATTTGTISDAPVRVFSLLTYVKDKQLTSKRIS